MSLVKGSFLLYFYSRLIEIRFSYPAIHPFKVCNLILHGICTELYSHSYNKFQSILITSKIMLLTHQSLSILPNSTLQFSSVAQSCPTLCDPMNCSTPGLPVRPPTPRIHSDSCPSSLRCHPAISSSVVPFSSCPQSLPLQEFACCECFTIGSRLSHLKLTFVLLFFIVHRQ